MTPHSPGYLETRRLVAERSDGCRDVVRRRQVEAELKLRQAFDEPQRASRARIAVPNSAQRLWQQHKYAVLARDERGYRKTGPAVAQGALEFEALADRLQRLLPQPPSAGGLRNAVEHMWGHVAERAESPRAALGDDPFHLLNEVGREAVRQKNEYLLDQVALSELFGWHDE